MTAPALTLVKYPYGLDPDISAALDQAVAAWERPQQPRPRRDCPILRLLGVR